MCKPLLLIFDYTLNQYFKRRMYATLLFRGIWPQILRFIIKIMLLLIEICTAQFP